MPQHRLPDTLKAAVWLHYVQQPSVTSEELAQLYGIGTTTVKRLLKQCGQQRSRRRSTVQTQHPGNPLLCLEDVTALLRIAESEDVSFAELLELFFTTDELLSHALSHASFYLSIDGGSVQVDGQVVNLRTSTRLDAIDRDAVADLYNEGHMTQAELGRLFGVSRQAVHQICFGSDYESNLAPRNDSANAPPVVVQNLQIQRNNVGRLEVKCDWCGAMHFRGETSRLEVIDGIQMRTFHDCCAHGKISFPSLPYPDELRPLLTRQDHEAEEFHRRIRSYNSACSFASINASTYNFPTRGAYCYRVHGAVVNKFNTAALAEQDERPKYGQLFVIDSNSALEHRLEEPANEGLNQRILLLIDDVLRRVNGYAQAFHTMGEIVERYEREAAQWCARNRRPLSEASVPNIRLAFDLKRSYRRSYNVPVVSEIAAVFVTHGGGEMPDAHIVVHPKGKNVRTLSTLSADLDPMSFALLFPYGTRGFTSGIPFTRQTGRRGNQSRREFVAYRLAVRENEFNPILFGGRLFQEYAVCQYIYVEADKMQWFRLNQKRIRAEHYDGVNNQLQRLCEQGGFALGRRVILPATHPGSPRAQERHYQDAMAIVRRMGKPHLFITMTANPNWPEITEACTYYVSGDPADSTFSLTAKPGFIKKVQAATDRPDLVSRVFDLKKEALLKKIFADKFFGEAIAHVYVIESQKRGNPHMHLLVTLSEETAPQSTADVDRIVRATIPDPVTEPELFKIVKKHHIHGPCDVGESVCLDESGKCTKRFPKPFRNESALGEDGYAEPSRPDSGPVISYSNGKVAHNGFVIPYNPELLLEFDCHINVELCGGIRFVSYLYKYFFKQLASAHLELTADGVLDCDEIKKHIDCRYIAAPEAIWRLLEKPMQGKSHSVTVLHVHQRHEKIIDLESGEAGISVDEDGKYVPEKSHLDAFFRLNQRDPQARRLYYYEVPEHYKWADGEWVPRVRRSNMIARLCNVDVRFSERYHLRLLLLHVKGPRSYDELKIVRGRCYRTFADACVARGLARNDEEWRECMSEASTWQFPGQLRQLFALILVWNNPRDPRKLWEEFKEAMAYDFVRYRNLTREQAINAAFAELAQELAVHGKSLRDFPTLPQTIQVADDAEVIDVEEELQEAARRYRMLSDEQRAFVEHVLRKLGMQFGGIVADNMRVRDPEGDAVFLDGPGGSGKTFTYLCLFHALRAYGFGVIVMASTGAAAILLPTGTTVHQAAALPVPLKPGCDANPRGRRLMKFASAHVFIWDEAPMMPRYALEAFDRLLREIHQNDLPFGGRMMILGGDFRQCLPIEENSLVSEQLNISLKRCDLWQFFTTFKLTKNLRLRQGQQQYDTWTMDVGEGRNLTGDDGQERILDDILFRGSLIDEVYGRLISGDPTLVGPVLTKYLAGRCILAVLNQVCTWYNDAIVDRLPGAAQVLTSFDEIVPESPDDTRRYPTELLHKLDLAGFPPHTLRLKKNAVVMMLRNIQPALGLVNGCRLLVVEAKRNVLLCRILNGSHAGQVREIPRITLTYEGRQYPFKFNRHQFPVRLAFAVSVNKSQGQTLDFVGADLRHQVFSHGQLYVILTRVRSMQSIRLLVDEGTRTTRNIVHKEIL